MQLLNYSLTPQAKKIYGNTLSGSTLFSAGLDLRVCSAEVLYPNRTELISTGLKVSIPEGYFGMVALRSSLGLKGLRLANGVGIIDSDYRGEILLALNNSLDVPWPLGVGDRIAQLVVIPHLPTQYEEVETLDKTVRGAGGFGSTGND